MNSPNANAPLQNEARRISRILSLLCSSSGHSSGPCVAAWLKQPTRKRRPRGHRTGRSIAFPYLALHREEFAWPRLLPNAPVSSYLTVSPITPKGWSILCCTCRHLLQGARTLSGSLPCGVRTFLCSSGAATARRASLQGFVIIAKIVEQ